MRQVAQQEANLGPGTAEAFGGRLSTRGHPLSGHEKEVWRDPAVRILDTQKTGVQTLCMTHNGLSTGFGWLAHNYSRLRGGKDRVSDIASLIDSYLCRVGRVLDVGTGPGEVAARLVTSERQVVGVDIAPEMVRLAAQALDGSAIQANAEALPFDADSFDGAVAVWVLNHVGNAEAALGELFRVLRPGARLFFLSGIPFHPDWDDLGIQLRRLDALRLSALRRERDISSLAESFGFVQKHVGEYVVDFEQRPRGLIRRLEERSYGHLRDVDLQTWKFVVEPVLENLRRMPNLDERRRRRNRHVFAVFEKPADSRLLQRGLHVILPNVVRGQSAAE